MLKDKATTLAINLGGLSPTFNGNSKVEKPSNGGVYQKYVRQTQLDENKVEWHLKNKFKKIKSTRRCNSKNDYQLTTNLIEIGALPRVMTSFQEENLIRRSYQN